VSLHNSKISCALAFVAGMRGCRSRLIPLMPDQEASAYTNGRAFMRTILTIK